MKKSLIILPIMLFFTLLFGSEQVIVTRKGETFSYRIISSQFKLKAERSEIATSEHQLLVYKEGSIVHISNIVLKPVVYENPDAGLSGTVNLPEKLIYDELHLIKTPAIVRMKPKEHIRKTPLMTPLFIIRGGIK